MPKLFARNDTDDTQYNSGSYIDYSKSWSIDRIIPVQQSNGNRPVIFLKTSLKDLPGSQGSHPAVEELAADDFE